MAQTAMLYEVGGEGDPAGRQIVVLGESGSVFVQSHAQGDARALAAPADPELAGWIAGAATTGGPLAAAAPGQRERRLTVTVDRNVVSGPIVAADVGKAQALAALDWILARALGGQGAAAGRGSVGPFEPTRTRRWTADGLVGVPDLGKLWDVEEKASIEAGGGVHTMSKARAQAGFFFMLAKDYTVPPSAAATTERLGEEILRSVYARNYQDVVYRSSGLIAAGGRTWHESRLSFRHEKVGAIEKWERVHAIGPRVLLLSAEGEPEMFGALGAIAKTWMDLTVHLARQAA
jgi:hypothetical protein